MTTNQENNIAKRSLNLPSDQIRTTKGLSRSSSRRANEVGIVFEKAEVLTATEILTDRSSRKIVFSDKPGETKTKAGDMN